ncbi:MAG: phosphotransferase [Rhodobacteraceae bacterium]|nr:phosphotransferase [Paracoccaceae bacterium]
MIDRETLISTFLAEAGWGDAARQALAGDASARRYERLSLGPGRAILMDAPPAAGESTERFARMDRWLLGAGYSPPQILAEDHTRGLLLLEDLGDALFARELEERPREESRFYTLATDFLVDLHAHTVPAFAPPLLARGLADLIAQVIDWLPRAMGQAPNPEASEIPVLIARLFEALSDGQVVLSLRDFHAENLLWLPERPGLAALGLLDFQDAVATHPAYDLVSLLQDARRDVTPETEAAMIARYAHVRGLDPDTFGAIYALLGAQRALRIIGVFMRLASRDGRLGYLRFVPRVWGTLQRDLCHPVLADLKEAVDGALPVPDISIVAANAEQLNA